MNANTKPAARAWQRMLSGRRLDLLDPSPLDVELEDIAHGLARVARWNGQTYGDFAFSVAQHSLLVEEVCGRLLKKPTRDELFYALLHDAAEFVIGDMISPFKAIVGGEYKLVEARLETAIHLSVGLPAKPSPALRKTIKRADSIVAYFEATELAGFTIGEAAEFFRRPSGFTLNDLNLEPMPAIIAEKTFLQRLREVERMA